MLRKLTMESLGTFFLTLMVLGVSPVLNPTSHFGVGLMLMILVYTGAHISGANYNPAVSWSIFIRKGMSFGKFLSYMGAQILGACLAGLIVYSFVNVPSLGNLLDMLSMSQELSIVTPLMKDLGILNDPVFSLDFFFREILFTFLFTFVVLQVATCDETKGNSYFGLVIGLTLTVVSFLHPLMGLNPAITLWSFIKSLLSGNYNTVFYTGALGAQFLGATLSGLFYHLLCCKECHPDCCTTDKNVNSCSTDKNKKA